MKLVLSDTIAEGWLQACVYLLGRPGWVDTTLVVHVDHPVLVRNQDHEVAAVLDRFLVAHDRHANHTVAETVFPGDAYLRHGADGVFKEYPEVIYPRIKDHPDMRKWGTYAYRLVRRQGEAGNQYNPLECCIQKMKDSRPKRAAYEIGLGFGFDLATYDDDDDRASRMGGPCLSHLSFKFIEGQVHLTAIYRSHYYVQRAFGNLLGLARLQAFVAAETQAGVGPLVCHSTMAVLESGREWGWLKSEIRPLMSDCQGAMEMRAEASAPSDPATSARSPDERRLPS